MGRPPLLSPFSVRSVGRRVGPFMKKALSFPLSPLLLSLRESRRRKKDGRGGDGGETEREKKESAPQERGGTERREEKG